MEYVKKSWKGLRHSFNEWSDIEKLWAHKLSKLLNFLSQKCGRYAPSVQTYKEGNRSGTQNITGI